MPKKSRVVYLLLIGGATLGVTTASFSLTLLLMVVLALLLRRPRSLPTGGHLDAPLGHPQALTQHMEGFAE